MIELIRKHVIQEDIMEEIKASRIQSISANEITVNDKENLSIRIW